LILRLHGNCRWDEDDERRVLAGDAAGAIRDDDAIGASVVPLCALLSVSVALLAPAMFTPLRCHW
jgi:hypothetical protein